MLTDAETELYRAIGGFSTVPQVSFTANNSGLGYTAESYKTSSFFYGVIPSQCAALLTSNYIFTLFIESWDINRSSGKPVFENKKAYPAKVTGLNIPYPQTQTFKWRDGLIDNSFNQVSQYQSYFRPGFGETILSDLNRPLLQVTVAKQNYLGLGASGESVGNSGFVGPFGRLMSAAFWVDPIEAKKYNASQSKKKKKSLNSQDYQENPTYPAYTPYQDNSGY